LLLRDADAVGVDHEVSDGAALGGVQDFEEPRVDGGFATRDLHDVRLSFVSDDAVEHAFDLVERFELRAMGSGLRVADGAGEIAGVADFEQRQAGVLFVVGAESAVVGTAELDGGVVAIGHFRGFDEDFATAAVVVDVIGHQDTLEAVGGATFEHEDLIVLEDDLGVDAAVARGADRDCGVVVEVRANAGWHGCPLRMFSVVPSDEYNNAYDQQRNGRDDHPDQREEAGIAAELLSAMQAVAADAEADDERRCKEGGEFGQGDSAL